MSATHLFLVALGLFYTVAGVIAVHATVQDAWVTTALDALGGGPRARESVERLWWLVLGGLVVSAGGVLLLALSVWAVVPFVLSTIAQGLYLLVLAPRRFDPVEPPTPEGRRQTTNAFWIYTAMTVIVCRTAWIGTLRPLRVTTAPAFAGAVLLWCVGAAYALRQLVRMSTLDTQSLESVPDDGSELSQPTELDDEGSR